MGLGGALVWGTGIPLLTSIAPEYAGRVTSLAESAIGFGLAIGPPLGSAMYSLGGYELPFLTSGAIELVLALLVFYALPNGPADEDNEKKSWALISWVIQKIIFEKKASIKKEQNEQIKGSSKNEQ